MRRALVVGIDNYASIPLKCCVNDADLMSSLLVRNHDGTPNFDVKTITTGLMRGDLKSHIAALFGSPAEISLFYFAGHGFIDHIGGYFVTVDAKQYDEGVSFHDVLSMANNSTAQQRIIIADCCHSGALGTCSVGSTISVVENGVTILTACRGEETALERSGHGIFTSLVCDALSGGASDILGNVTPGGIYNYVDQALGAWDQRPLFKTNVSNFVSIRQCKPIIGPQLLRKICEYFPDPDFNFQLDPSFESTAEQHNARNESIFADLQKYRSCHLVEPVGEEHMYYAAMNSKTCRLTPFGYQYWRLAKEGKI